MMVAVRSRKNTRPLTMVAYSMGKATLAQFQAEWGRLPDHHDDDDWNYLAIAWLQSWKVLEGSGALDEDYGTVHRAFYEAISPPGCPYYLKVRLAG